MSSGHILYMAVILSLVWGGFAYCLFLLATQRDPDDDEAQAERDSD